MFTKPMARALAAFGIFSDSEPAAPHVTLKEAGESPTPIQAARVPPHLRHLALGVDQALAVYADKRRGRGRRARSITPEPRAASPA
jgi:hypothetical protein